jgi:branched-chain amino acid transport system ATP-binding protein
MNDTDLIVDARGVHAWYGSSHVLHGVDLQIGRGETSACSAAMAWARAR